MADISANLYQWSATAGSNNPSGTTTIGTGLDDNLRQIQATVRQDLANKGSDIASATTTDLGAVIGLMHDITGTTTITGFGTVSAGIWKIIKFEGALTLTHNGTSLILPGAANITTVAGDVGIFMSEGSGNWRCLSWLPTSNAAAGALTAGRVPIVGTAGKLTDDADFTFDTATLTVHTLTVSTGVITSAAGSVGAPSINFSDATTGFYRPSANAIGVAISGALDFQFNATNMNFASGNSLQWNGGDAAVVNSSTTLLLQTYDGSALNTKITIAAAGQITFTDPNNVSAFAFHTYVSNAATAGSITRVAQTNAVTFNTTSDARHKNVFGQADAESAKKRIMAHKMREFEWKDYPGTRFIGPVAQEAYEVDPNPMLVRKGGDDALNSPWSVNMSGYVPDLILTVQSLEGRLAALEARP